MGFKDFFTKGPSGRNDNHRYNHGIPTHSMSGISATEQRYAQNISSTGLHPTTYYRHSQQQPPQRTMSLSSRNLRNYDSQPRTMSLSMRSSALSNQHRNSTHAFSRSSSINSSSINPRTISRTNSLNTKSRTPYNNKQMSQKANSLSNSRNNSLTSNMTHTKIIKTTKETDMDGRTRSITTTTIEQRGDMKIVRTTVIQPSDVIDEDTELEELAEMEDEFANFDEEVRTSHGDFNEFGDTYEGGNLIEKHHVSQNTAALAANAAAAALGMNSHLSNHHQSPRQRQLQNYDHLRNNQMNSPNTNKSQSTPVISPLQGKTETSFHVNNSNYVNSPNRVQMMETDVIDATIISDQRLSTLNTFENVPTSPSDLFEEKANKRLSQIQEVTEVYDTSKSTETIDAKYSNEGTNISREALGSPFAGFTGSQKPQLHVNATNSTLNSTEDHFEEAQEIILPDPPAMLNINDPPSHHSYRDLAETRVTSIPTPPSSHRENLRTINNQQRNLQSQQDVDSFISQQTPRKLKSALKNSSSSVSSSNYGDSQHRLSQNYVKQDKQTPRLSQPVTRNPEHTQEEIYAMAMKAAEKKVYGDRLNQIYVQPPLKEDVDAATLQNTLNNVQTTSGTYQSSHPGEQYTSNASGLGFKLHSLRDSKDVKSAKRNERQDSSKKKFFKNEQKAQRKKWEEERRAIADTNNPITEKISEDIENLVNRMPIDPAVESELQQQQPRQQSEKHKSSVMSNLETSPKKSKFGIFRLGKKKEPSPKQHKKSSSVVSQDSSRSTSSTSKKKLFSFGKVEKQNDTADLIMQVKQAKPFSDENLPSEATVVREERVAVADGPIAVENMETIPEHQIIQHEVVSHVDIPVEVPLADTAATTESSGDEPLPSNAHVNIVAQEEVYTDAVTGLEHIIADDSNAENIQGSLLKATHVSKNSSNVEHAESKNTSKSNSRSGSKLLRFFNL